MDQLVLLEVPAGDPHRHGSLPGRDDNPDPGVPAAPHRTAARVDHEADQEPGNVSTFNYNTTELECSKFTGIKASWDSASLKKIYFSKANVHSWHFKLKSYAY